MAGVESVVLQKHEEPLAHRFSLPPGRWGVDPDGFIWVRCPHDQHADKRPRIGVILHSPKVEKDWNIAADGTVTPSIFFDEPNCGWHVHAKLEGWRP